MDWIVSNITILVEFGIPILPYLIIGLLTYQIMSRAVKPLIEGHMTSSGAFTSVKWMVARRCMVFYPMLLGCLMALPFGLNIGYAIGAGASAQLGYHLIRDLLKKYDIELPGDNSIAPPGE